MTPCLKTFAKNYFGPKYAYALFSTSVYLDNSFETQDNLPLKKNQTQTKANKQKNPQIRQPFEMQILKKKCRTEIRVFKGYCFHQSSES